MRNVSTIPARNALRSPRLMDCSAQCIVKLEVTRIAVFTPATKTGKWYGSGGQWPVRSGLTTRTKKYAAKNEPKSMVSEPMKRSMPSVRGSTRELWFAGGRAVVVACRGSARRARVMRAPPRAPRRRRAGPGARSAARSRPTRSRRSQPERSPGNVETMISSVRSSSTASIAADERVRVCDLAVHVDALRAQHRERRAETALRLGMLARVGSLCGHTMRKLAAPSCARCPNAVEQRLAEHGLVGDDEDVRAGSPAHVGHDVLDGPIARGLADLVDEVLPQPARLRLRMGGHDDLVDVLGREHVLHRRERLVVEHAAVGRDPGSRSAARTRSSLRPAAARRESR